MSVRPVFVPSKKRGPLLEVVPIEFDWYPGFALVQKQRSIRSLHQAAKLNGLYPLLEVSTKSTEELGRRLSAFNLKIEVDGEMLSLESVYQGSKVFSVSGQHIDLMFENPFVAKKSVRELGVGTIVKFRCFGIDYPIEPKNAFYDWLYIRAIRPHEEWIKRNINYIGYTDIEFNPEKSVNCQGRAVAEFMALSMRGSTDECFDNFFSFREILMLAQRGE